MRPAPKRRYVPPTISNKDVVIIRLAVKQFLIRKRVPVIEFNANPVAFRAFWDEDREAEEREAKKGLLDSLRR